MVLYISFLHERAFLKGKSYSLFTEETQIFVKAHFITIAEFDLKICSLSKCSCLFTLCLCLRLDLSCEVSWMDPWRKLPAGSFCLHVSSLRIYACSVAGVFTQTDNRQWTGGGSKRAHVCTFYQFAARRTVMTGVSQPVLCCSVQPMAGATLRWGCARGKMLTTMTLTGCCRREERHLPTPGPALTTPWGPTPGCQVSCGQLHSGSHEAFI